MNSSKTKAIWIGSKKYSDQVICPDFKLLWSHSNFKLLGIEFSLDMNSIVEINVAKKIKEVSAILKSWQHRKLTLLGKITVIKTLALPKLIHLLTALPNLSPSKINEFYYFVWNGKTNRVKRNTLIGDISQGGLNMVHLPSFNHYLKLSWVKRFLTNPEGNWQYLLQLELSSFGGERVFNFQKEKLAEVSIHVKNPFWKDTLYSLSLAKPLTKSYIKDIMSLDILNFVPVTNFSIYVNLKHYGVQFLKDIVDCNSKTFIPFLQFKEKTNIKNFLLYYRLLSNIPKFIKDNVKEHCQDINLENFVPVDPFISKISANQRLKFIYDDLVNLVFVKPQDKFQKWENVLDTELNNWSKYFVIMKKCCHDTYLKNFQYKLLLRILPTNSFLYKIKLKATNLCSLCGLEDETLEHLFYDCNVTKNFWLSFEQSIKKYDANFVISKEQVLLGFPENNLFINLIFIIAKNFFI